MDDEKWRLGIWVIDQYTGAKLYVDTKKYEQCKKELDKILSDCKEALEEYTWRFLLGEPLIIQYWKTFERGF